MVRVECCPMLKIRQTLSTCYVRGRSPPCVCVCVAIWHHRTLPRDVPVLDLENIIQKCSEFKQLFQSTLPFERLFLFTYIAKRQAKAVSAFYEGAQNLHLHQVLISRWKEPLAWKAIPWVPESLQNCRGKVLCISTSGLTLNFGTSAFFFGDNFARITECPPTVFKNSSRLTEE